MARHVCHVLQISFLPLAKSKPLKRFDEKPAWPITHAIYPTLTVQGHFELLVSMLVTSLGQYLIILGKPWMQKHGVILDMGCNKFTFWLGYCQHSRVKRSLVPAVKRLAPTQKSKEPYAEFLLAPTTKLTKEMTTKYIVPAR